MTALDAPVTAKALSLKNKIGLVLAVLISLVDLAGLVVVPGASPNEPGPPPAILIFGAAMGLITISAAVLTWRTGNRIGSRVVAGTRILSALTAVPAFFVPDVPAGLVVSAAGGIVVTLLLCWLVLSRPTS